MVGLSTVYNRVRYNSFSMVGVSTVYNRVRYNSFSMVGVSTMLDITALAWWVHLQYITGLALGSMG